MFGILKKIKSQMFDKEIVSTYDTYNTETESILNNQIFTGVKTEITKTITPNMQLAHVSIKNQRTTTKQMFCNLSFSNSLLQASIDQDKNTQVRGTCLYGNVLAKFNTVIGRETDVFGQIEFDVRNRYNNLCCKIIQPAVKGASTIYIGNCMQRIGPFNFGTEVVRVDNYLGISFALRYERSTSIISLSCQQFSTCLFEYYNSSFKMVDYTLRVVSGKDTKPNIAMGIRVHGVRGVVIGNIDTNKTMSISYNDNLSEGLRVTATCKMENDEFTYGYGFSYEF